MANEKICVLGLGYIGLPTALMLAASNQDVIGVDFNLELINTLKQGKVTFQEDGLEELFTEALQKGIVFDTKYHEADIYIVAVPTPFEKDTKKINSSYVSKAVNNVLDVCKKGAILVIESTVSPGTTDKFIRPVITNRGWVVGEDVHLVHAPERIIPGRMIHELRYNSRVVGSDCPTIGERVRDLYASFCQSEIVITSIRTAEMSKVVENTYRDINIAFANELAKICRQDDLDVYDIIKIANMHPRVNILQPGPGVGGHCISVDPWFLVGDYPSLSLLIHEARKINDSMPSFVLKRVHDIIIENQLPKNTKVGFYGLTYKEDVDDTRESPTLQLYEQLQLHLGGDAFYYDPMIDTKVVEGQLFDFDEFVKKSDIVVVMVGHTHIKENASKLTSKYILDTRNIINELWTYKL